MRLTKNAKKVLAATLSMALVVSGVTVGTKQAKAADALKWTGSFTMGTSYEAKAIEVKTDEGSTIEIKGNDYNNFEADFKVDLSAFTDPVITVTATEASDGAVHNFAVCNANNWSPVYAGVNENNGGVPADTKTITGKLDKAVTDYVITAQGRTVSNITITDGSAPVQTAAPEATVTPGVTTAPAVSAAPAETTAPTAEPTPTPDVAQTPAPDNTDDPDDNTEEAEASLTVAKKTVSIKAGKSVTVKYTATNADGDAVKAKATSANKKVAKVKVSSKKAIKITVPKNVKKGKKAVVTVKAAGKTAKIKVKVK